LAARARQEVGTYSGSVTGTYSPSYPFVYNYYNIGALDTGDPVLNGLQWALLGPDRKADYTSTDEKYLIPWQDQLDAAGKVTKALGRYRSIVGGPNSLAAPTLMPARTRSTCRNLMSLTMRSTTGTGIST